MNILALILCIMAAISFLSIALGAAKAWLLPLGLALLTSGLIFQFVWVAHQVVAH